MPFFRSKITFKASQAAENYGSKNMNDHDDELKKDSTLLTVSDEELLRKRGYVLLRQVGEGSYAKVYLANQVKDGKAGVTLACKVINTKQAPREFVTKFLPREIDILSKITHPFIVYVYSIFHKTNNYLIFMRYAEMGDLLDYIMAKGELPENVCRIWFHQLSCAVYYLHSLNIAHRDIKCENILISSNHNLKITDFGFARYVADINGKQLLSTTYCGSLSYASPEILRGKSYYPKYSDIWALGVVLYIMLNKSVPFHDANVKLLYKQQMKKSWKFRTKIEPTLSEQVKTMVKNLLEPDFRIRLKASELLEDVWFTNQGLGLSEECRTALKAASKYKKDMIPKKRSKIANLWNGKDENDFIVVSQEKENLESNSEYFEPNPLTRQRKAVLETNTEMPVDESFEAPPSRVASSMMIVKTEAEDQ